MASTASPNKTDNSVLHCITTVQHSYNWGRDISNINQHPQSISQQTAEEHSVTTETANVSWCKQAEKVLTSTPVTVQTSTENGNGIASTRVSTSPFLATDNEKRASRQQKVRIRSSAKRHGYYEQRIGTTRSTTTEEQDVDRLSPRTKQISTSSESSVKKDRMTPENIKWTLRQNGIEKLYQSWILREIGIQIDQPEDANIGQSENREIHAKSAVKLQVRAINSKKTSEPSTTSAPGQGASTESAPGLSKQYKKQKRQLFNPTLSQVVEQNTSLPTTRASRRISAAASNSSFQNLTTNSSFQNYLRSVCMARTKETARKNRDDQMNVNKNDAAVNDNRSVATMNANEHNATMNGNESNVTMNSSVNATAGGATVAAADQTTRRHEDDVDARQDRRFQSCTYVLSIVKLMSREQTIIVTL